MNLLYLHGLYSHPVPDKIALLAKKATQVVAPQLDYFNHPDLFGWLLEEMTKHQVDYLVGSSAGGLMAYWLGRVTGCKALLFNPALNRTDMRPDILKHTKTLLDNSRYFFDIIIGEQDDTIPPQSTLDFLELNDSPAHYKLHTLPALGHKIDLETFAWATELLGTNK
jgi:hypothetical protein